MTDEVSPGLKFYMMRWTSALEWGTEDAQEMAMYALRSWGWDVSGCDYGSAFHWHVIPCAGLPDESWVKERVVHPDYKPRYGVPMAERASSWRCPDCVVDSPT